MVRTSLRTTTFNRDRIDIIASILAATNGGATRRRILLISGLSSNQFKRYLSLLVKDQYIRVEEDKKKNSKHKFYVATGKGMAFLNAYSCVRELLQDDPGLIK